MEDFEKAKHLFLLAIEDIKNGNLEEAEVKLKNSLKIIPNRLSTMNNLANVFLRLNKQEEAAQLIEEIIRKNPNDYDSNLIKSRLFEINGRYREALETLDNIIHEKHDEDCHEALYSRGKILEKLLNFQDAIKDYEKVIYIKPNHLNSYIRLGLIFYKIQRYEESIRIYNDAIKINNKESDIYNNLGLSQIEIGLYSDAISNFEIALKINPNLAGTYLNIGVAYVKKGQKKDSIFFFEKAININKNYVEAYENLGKVHQELKNLDKAVEYYQSALKINPKRDYLHGILIHAKMCMCDWSEFDENLIRLEDAILKNEKCSPPFPVINLIESSQIQLKVAKIWSDSYYPINNLLGPIQKKEHVNKIKVAYFSSDFREHAVSYLIAELFELHDKSKFEIYTFYFGPEDSSLLHKRIVNSSSKNYNVKNLKDYEIANLSREIGIDIAVDLNGATANQRTKIFSYRPAPIQIGYLGYLGTMGSDLYDYIVADKTLIPINDQKNFTEKIIYIPSYQINDRKRSTSHNELTKKILNIPDNGFIFCCFNNNYKYSPSIFESWMRILRNTYNSFLYLYADNEWVKQNILNETQKHGVDISRIIFADFVNRNDYLLRYKFVDLFLDTYPYNAGTTASDALWASVPIVTRMGNSFASRICASILNALQIPELITSTKLEYETLAIELANNPELIGEIRKKIDLRKSSSLLFNTPKWVENIEIAYTKIFDRYQVGFMPANIYI